MDWSATLSLTTSRAQQHRPNYGSFSSSASPLKRLSSASTISIPQSIPEHQCVVQFASPRLQHAELQIIEQYEILGNDATKRLSGGSTTTLTITETPESSRLHTFKMLLTNPSASSIISRLDSSSKLSVAAPAASDDTVSSYWLQERERMRLQRERRHLTRNGSPVKAATLRDDDDPETSQWKTAAIMCSVPLVLVLVFVIVMLVYGDGLAGADAASASIFSASATTGSRLRGSVAAASHGS